MLEDLIRRKEHVHFSRSSIARPCGIILVLAALAAGGFLFPAALSKGGVAPARAKGARRSLMGRVLDNDGGTLSDYIDNAAGWADMPERGLQLAAPLDRCTISYDAWRGPALSCESGP